MSDHSNKLRNLMESLNWTGFTGVEMPLSRPDVAACVAAQMGGEERMKTHYPTLYRAYQEGRKRAADAIQAPMPKGFCDMAKILDVGYSSSRNSDDVGQAFATGNMTPTGPVNRMCLTLDLYAEDTLIAHNMEIVSHCLSGEIETIARNVAPLGKGKQYKAYMQVTWEPQDGSGLRTMFAQAEGYGAGEEIIDTVEVENPRKRNGLKEEIIVAYARNATSGIDYYYAETRNPATGNEKVMLDVSGKAFFKDGYTLSDVDVNRTGMSLTGYSLGAIIYMGDITFKESEKERTLYPVEENGRHGIGWKFNREWNNEIQQSVQAGNRRYDFDLSVYFRCKEDESLHRLYISSQNAAQGCHKKIPAIRLYWGCLSGDTLVALPGNQQKKISELREGDLILDGETGESQKISSLIRGTEDVLYVLGMLDGTEIRASIDHPFLTNEGYKAVRSLHCGLSLKKQDGTFTPVAYCYPEPHDPPVPVYNLELEMDHRSYVANGLISGTNLLQGQLLKQAQQEALLLTPDPEIEAECEKMRADRENGLL